jgi:hypothetical protein
MVIPNVMSITPVIANATSVIANAVKQSHNYSDKDCFVPRNDEERY